MKKPGFLSRLFRPSTKGLADPGPEVWGFFGLTAPAAGITISHAQALQVPAVASAVRLISEATAILPCRVMERQADGTFAEAPDHEVNEFLQVRANDWTTPFELIRDLVIDGLTDDRGGLAHVNYGGGRPFEIIRYRTGVMSVTYDPVTNEPTYRVDNRRIPLAEALHLRSPFGKSPLSLALQAIGVAHVLQNHAAGLFSRGARPSGALKFPKGMGEESVKRARAAWRETHEAEGETGKTAILYDGAEFEAFTFASTDAQFLENRKFQILEIARHFRVPPSMIFDMDRATWGNTEQMGREFLTYSLEPWLKALESAFQRAFFYSAEDRGRYVVRFDRDDMTRADFATRSSVVNTLIASKVINPNEGRDWFGYGPRPGGDEFENPNINPEAGGQAPAKEPGQEAGGNGADNQPD